MQLAHKLANNDEKIFSYFSMEVGLNKDMHTYSGGLGILAGDTIKSFADRHVPIVCITLLNEKGYFNQHITPKGAQQESDADWDVKKYLTKLNTQIEIEIENRKVAVTAWELKIKGCNGYEVPLYFLDTDIEGNSKYDRTLTKHLYGGDNHYRLCQEVVLGIGGTRFIHASGHKNIERYHMNEGHAAFLTLELLRENNFNKNEVKKQCVFTTHTPVASGHDAFPKEEIDSVLGKWVPKEFFEHGTLSMTKLGLALSHYINGVAKKHGEVSRKLFPKYDIDYITNGVHSASWTHSAFQELFDKKIPTWRRDPYSLRYATQFNLSDIWNAHKIAKADLVKLIKDRTGTEMDPNVFTIGFARRATSYKRMDLLFHDIERLKYISQEIGTIQLVFAGKAHVRDFAGKELIKRIWDLKNNLGNIKLVFLENYNIELAQTLIPGVDLWLNTPRRPLEASGTSGMKAVHNAVPSLSILDGWWIEGHIENYTGWAIGDLRAEEDDGIDANDMYFKLEKIIIPMFYNNLDEYIKIMRNSIAYNASFFNTYRMVSQYVLNAYIN